MIRKFFISAILLMLTLPAFGQGIFIAVDNNSGSGTAENPLESPTVINVSAFADGCTFNCAYEWSFSMIAGSYCPGEFGQLFFGSEPAAQYNVGRVSVDATFDVKVTIINGEEITSEKKFVYVSAAPGGCSGGGGGGGGGAPTNVSLSTNLSGGNATPGQNFIATASGTSSEPITFTFFGSTTAAKPSIPLGQVTRTSCSNGCSAQQGMFAPTNSTGYYIWADLSTSSGSSSKSLFIGVGSGGGGGGGGGGEQCTSPTFSSTSCGTKIDAGCPTISTVGGATLDLDGAADHPAFDSGTAGGVIPVAQSYLWTIENDGGLGSALQLQNADKLSASLVTPQVTTATNVTVKLTGTISSCTGSDTSVITIMPQQSGGGSSADLQITPPTGPITASLDEEFQYQASIKNNGPAAATGVSVQHSIPTNTDFINATFAGNACSVQALSIVCPVGDLAVNQIKQGTFIFKGKSSGDAQANMSVSGSQTDGVTTNNVGSVLIKVQALTGADLSVSSVQNPVNGQVGQNLNYSLIVLNNGPETATDVVLQHTVPASLEYISAQVDNAACTKDGSTVTCDLGQMAKSQTRQVSFQFKAIDDGTSNATATVSGQPADPLDSDNSLALTYQISPAADLKLTATAPTSIILEEEFSYQLTSRNLGPSVASNVLLAGSFPQGTTVLSGPQECAIAGTDYSCELGTLLQDAQELITFQLSIATVGDFQASATLSATEADPDSSNNSVQTTLAVAEQTSLIFPHSVEPEEDMFPKETFVGIAVYNPGSEETDVEFIAYDALGEEVDRVLLSSLDGLMLGPNGQVAKTTSQITVLDGVTALSAKGVSSRVQGFFLVGDQTLSSLDGVAGNLVEGERLYFPLGNEGPEESTKLLIYNPDSDHNAEIFVTLFDPLGDPIEVEIFELPPLGSILKTVKQIFGLSEFQGYVRLTASHPVKGLELYTNGREISAVGGQVGTAANRLIVPHFFSIGEDGTTIRLLNTKDEAALAVIKAYSDAGVYLGGTLVDLGRKQLYEARVSDFLNLQGDVSTGYILIDFEPSPWEQNPGSPSVIGMVTFSTGGSKTLATLPLLVSGRDHSKFLHVAQSQELKMFTGLAILNAGQSPANVTLKVFDEQGQVAREKTLSALNPGKRVVKLLSELLEDPAFEQIGGHFEVDSDGPVVVFALFGDIQQRYLAAIEGQGR